ncbi:acyltransferase [Massilia sp. Root335]|uniref:acyltransferase family protein n=1 Tax=Massilia sp. Root335 TaxID=1736517 RepID=UPI0007009126|nr:acyltransferase [Massilia sp. Root335]KQV37854.1 acyltransferase [Massilia sp. Root335]
MDGVNTGGPPRIHGLDTLRALAVSLVVLHHYTLFVSDAPTFGWIGTMGWAGVDLFFALSGYLIGNQIFGALGSARGFGLGRFYARRLLRTLPNFWVVLALYALWPAWRGATPMLPLWQYLTFTQNIHLQPGTAFSHAWSLCIEEQFYMLLPAAAIAGAALGRAGVRLRWAWIALLLAVAGGMLARATIWHDGQHAANRLGYYYQYIYYSSWCRCDELLAGVALALLRRRAPGSWRRLLAHGNALLAAGLCVTAGTWAWFLGDHYGLAQTVAGYPLLALGCSLLILAALAPDSLLHRVRVPGAASLALWSYAIYLTHKSVSILVAGRMARAGFGAGDGATIAACLLASLLAGWLLFVCVETPFMRLLARWDSALSPVPAPALR